MTTTKDRRHGSYKIEVNNQTITVRFYGSWSKETSEKMCKAFMQEVTAISNKPWACIIDLTEWELGVPEAWAPIAETNRWCAKNNQVFEAVVCTMSIQKFILKALQQELPNTESEFFASESQAINWLAEKGFILS
ncbi:MAG: hypothetical protein HWE10_00815 [Gammaproteobacteria bacterium]|nr:hypothetical protein [Gammaproteobacteria bacterium]